jgi:hypothetical protein
VNSRVAQSVATPVEDGKPTERLLLLVIAAAKPAPHENRNACTRPRQVEVKAQRLARQRTHVRVAPPSYGLPKGVAFDTVAILQRIAR